MASDGSRKQITFDLCTDALKRHYPHQEPPPILSIITKPTMISGVS